MGWEFRTTSSYHTNFLARAKIYTVERGSLRGPPAKAVVRNAYPVGGGLDSAWGEKTHQPTRERTWTNVRRLSRSYVDQQGTRRVLLLRAARIV